MNVDFEIVENIETALEQYRKHLTERMLGTFSIVGSFHKYLKMLDVKEYITEWSPEYESITLSGVLPKEMNREEILKRLPSGLSWSFSLPVYVQKGNEDKLNKSTGNVILEWGTPVYAFKFIEKKDCTEFSITAQF